MAGLYVHIPFCASRCIYCGFYSTTGKESLQDSYIDAIIKEYRARKSYLGGEKIKTIYLGGGTPSLLSFDNLRRLGSFFVDEGIIANSSTQDICKESVEEFTMECNPNDISEELCHTLEEIGVNRVSLGIQTFSDDRLSFLRRRHRSCEIAPAIEMLRRCGIDNISIDLMFGFPGETIEEWRNDIEKALSLNVEHISAYSLMYEEGTPLYSMLERGEISENSENNSVEMYDCLVDMLEAHGYEHYEISNFAKPGKRSMHNSSYWNGTIYLGLGAAAHSYDGVSREWNVSDIRQYIDGMTQGPRNYEREELDSDTRYNDLVTTALRTKEGINLSLLESRYYNYIKRYARESISNGLLEETDGHLRLTRKGYYVSDTVMADLIYA